MTEGDGNLVGGCHCGAIRYRLRKPPAYSMVCHCRTCQGISGAPVIAWVTSSRADFAFVQGTPTIYRSSEGVERRFCGACGTQLTYAATREPAWIDVSTASLDNPSAFPPTHHSWLSHNIRWVQFGDGLPGFPESRPSA